jgi:hypothetical protein
MHAQKFIVPCPAIAVQREAIPEIGIALISDGDNVGTQLLSDFTCHRMAERLVQAE